jgi:hypothetical protein
MRVSLTYLWLGRRSVICGLNRVDRLPERRDKAARDVGQLGLEGEHLPLMPDSAVLHSLTYWSLPYPFRENLRHRESVGEARMTRLVLSM